MAIKNVRIEEGCTACGLCADICPEVFTIEDISVVKQGVNFDNFESQIREAAENCPVEVIKIDID